MKEPFEQNLVEQVQHNCHIADSRHAASFGLCTYLLKMREFYRWERNLPFDASLPKDEVGAWLEAREGFWEGLVEQDYRPLRIGGEAFDPFDASAINRALESFDLVYSGGLGHGGKPHFFLGRLHRRESEAGCEILVSGQELARDLAAPPGMYAQGRIFLRRESLKRMLWERLQNWRWSRRENTLGRAFGCYGFDDDLEGALEAMTETELTTVLLHERGEFLADRELGAGWNELLLSCAGSRAELMLRSVRDHWADCSTTLPALAERGDPAPVHFFVGNLSGMRQEIFPMLTAAYEDWRQGGDGSALIAAAQQGEPHWRRLALQSLERAERGGDALADDLVRLIEGCYL